MKAKAENLIVIDKRLLEDRLKFCINNMAGSWASGVKEAISKFKKHSWEIENNSNWKSKEDYYSGKVAAIEECISILQNLQQKEKEQPEPLFISEDGVNVFEGDELFTVYKYGKVKNIGNIFNIHKKPDDRYCFSTKEAAEKYLIEQH